MRWTVQPLVATDGADMAICSDSDIVAIIQHDPGIQTSEEVDGDNVIWSPEDLARAKLIAAAPELLAALEVVMRELGPRYTEDTHGRPWVTAALAAIANAR